MTANFKLLNQEAYSSLKDAIALITILVAGADGKIDFREADWAEKLTEVRSYAANPALKSFYKDVGLDYQSRFDYYIDVLPVGVEARTNEISEKLSELNDILASLPNKTAVLLYEDFLSFAKHVAKKSGGFLGFMTVSRAEERVMKLKMINKIEAE